MMLFRSASPQHIVPINMHVFKVRCYNWAFSTNVSYHVNVSNLRTEVGFRFAVVVCLFVCCYCCILHLLTEQALGV